MTKSPQQFDVVVVGAGIAGATIAYFLAKEGKKVAVIDKAKVASGASGAAGAFLSPMMGKPNRVLNMVNSALDEALDLYKEIASDLMVANGLERFIKSDEDSEKFWQLAKLINVPHTIRSDAIFFHNAGVICAEALCKRLLQQCTVFENQHATDLMQVENGWKVSDLMAKTVVLATGAYKSLIPSKYMKMRGVWGERLALFSPQKIPHNISREVMISATLSCNILAVGATHIRKDEWITDPNAKDFLFDKAVKMLPDLMSSSFVDLKSGMRPSAPDYLPVAGRAVDVHKTLTDYPQIKDGMYPKNISYIKDLFVHTGHGGRGFVTAVHTAKKLADLIIHGKRCEYEPLRLLINNLRRDPEKYTKWRDEWIKS